MILVIVIKGSKWKIILEVRRVGGIYESVRPREGAEVGGRPSKYDR